MQELTVKSMWSSMVLIAGDETKEHMNTNRKYLRPSEVEEIYGIKQGTLTKQRSQGYGLPYVVIGRKPKKRKGGIILYAIDVIEYIFVTLVAYLLIILIMKGIMKTRLI